MIAGMRYPAAGKWARFVQCLFLCLSFSLFFSPVGAGAYDLSIEDERIAGERFVDDVKKQFEVMDDDFLNTYINDLGKYLTEPLETKPFPFRFYIINDRTLNAFAGPGGHIFVFSGLVEIMTSIDELSSVICHEIGHVSARHIAQRIEQNKKIGLATMATVLAAVLIGGEASGPIITGSIAAGAQAQLHYSREDERQADQLGFKYMHASGYHPGGMISILEKLQRGQWGQGDRIPPYLRTHPAGPERISRAEAMLAKFDPGPEKSEAVRFSDDFPMFRTIMRALNPDPYEAERLFLMDQEKAPESIMAHLGLGIVHKRKSDYEKAVHHLETALNDRPDSVPILCHLGETYQLQGKDREAIRILEKALRIDNRDRAALNLIGASYQSVEDYPRAVHVYERLTTIPPVRDEAFYRLGVAYGRQNRLAEAHYNFGIYFKRQKERKKALFHFDKAASFASSDPALREKIEENRKDLR
ncbi:MAG: M48 family metalloprotease [Desulfatiglandales bacterium]